MTEAFGDDEGDVEGVRGVKILTAVAMI